MHATRKVKLKDLSPNLTCYICRGYFIDATTIIECVHSFCRACIVQHLEKSEYCPVCDVQLHSSRPLSSIRSDKMLQEIVYKLVPGLFQNEMTNRRKYYNEHAEVKPRTQQDGGQVFNESYITSDDMIHLSLEFDTTDKKLRESTKRFILCPAAVSIAVLKKLIQGKYDLKNISCIEIMYRERYLPDDFLLMDIAYKYSWSQNGNGPLQLYYRVLGVPQPPSPFKCKSLPRESLTVKSYSTPATMKRLQTVGAESKFTPLQKGAKAKKSITPTGRPRGRPKRKRSISSEEPPMVENKKPKLEKKTKEKEKKKATGIKEQQKTTETDIGNTSQGMEVQLRISENGIISAKSTSGEEKIINPSASPQKTSSSSSAFNGFCPSPIKFSRKPITTNGSHPRRPRTLNPTEFGDMDQDSPIPLTKKKLENGNNYEGSKSSKSTEGNSPSGKLGNIAEFKRTPPMLKVPTPNKWIPHSNGVNGDEKPVPLKLVTKTSPVKDSSSFNTSTNAPSTSKKPPKFFKSRISETQTHGGTNGHNHTTTKADAISEATSIKKDLKVPLSNANKTTTTGAYGTDKFDSASYDGQNLNNAEKRKPESTIPIHPEPPPPEPSPPSQSQSQPMHHHQFPTFGLHVDDNMSMGNMLQPMHFVPSLTNGYYPFFPNPNTAIHPLLQMAMSMNLNSSFAYNSLHGSTQPNPIPCSNGSNKSQKKTKGKSLDLSMPSSKKSKSSSYVQISPKKTQPPGDSKVARNDYDKKDVHEVRGNLTNSALSLANVVGTPSKKECTAPTSTSKPGTPRKLATPKKILSTTNVPPVPTPTTTAAVHPAKDYTGSSVESEEQESDILIPSPTKDNSGNGGAPTKNGPSATAAPPLETLSNDGNGELPTPAAETGNEVRHEIESSSTSADPPPPVESPVSLPLETTTKEMTLESGNDSTKLSSEPRPQSPTATVLATLTMTLDEKKERSEPGSGTAPEIAVPGGKSPSTTINNNNNNIVDTIPESSGVGPCPPVPMNLVSSSTTTTTSSA